MKNIKEKAIYFDMDGTIANLYAVENWLPMLRAYNPTPYEQAKVMVNMSQLARVLNQLKAKGYHIGIVSWLSKQPTREYDMAVRQAKLDWLEEMGFPYDFFHCVKYGTTKANTIRKYMEIDETAILIDDNDKVRNGWSLGETINPTDTDIIDFIRGLI